MANYHGPSGSISIPSQGDRTSVSNALLTHTSTSTEARGHRTRQIFKEIQGVQSRRIPRRPRSWWGLTINDTIPPLPPQFKRRTDEDEVMPYDVRSYHQRITRGDYGLGPGGLGLRSPVIELLQKDAMDRYHGGIPRLRWKHIKNIASKVDIWELSSVDSDEKLKVAIKHETIQPHSFYKDYLFEALFTKRMNMAGCNDIITVIDWYHEKARVHTKESPRQFKIAYEWGQYGDLDDFNDFNIEHHLIWPEPFIWHVFKGMASALAYCNDGTNIGYPIPGWDPMIHSDIKPGNIFVFSPDEKENKLYPQLKLADLGISYAVPTPAVGEYFAPYRIQYGTKGFLPPEDYERNKIYEDHKPESKNDPHSVEYPASYHPTAGTDVWTLGNVIKRLISLIHRWIPRRIYKHLVSKGYKRPFYSPALNRLVEQCLELDPLNRPTAHQVYMLASHFYDIHRKKLFERYEYSKKKGIDVYLGQVLYTDADRKRIDENPDFKTAYLEANRGPLRDWLGISRKTWRELDPDAPPKDAWQGPKPSDLVVPRLEQLDINPRENARQVLENEAMSRWMVDYYEAAGNLLPPRPKPDPLALPDTPTVQVLGATWENVPQARKNSIEDAWMYFRNYHYGNWVTRDYDAGDLLTHESDQESEEESEDGFTDPFHGASPLTEPSSSDESNADANSDGDGSDSGNGHGGGTKKVQFNEQVKARIVSRYSHGHRASGAGSSRGGDSQGSTSNEPVVTGYTAPLQDPARPRGRPPTGHPRGHL